jgi:hypothetical protein
MDRLTLVRYFAGRNPGKISDDCRHALAVVNDILSIGFYPRGIALIL